MLKPPATSTKAEFEREETPDDSNDVKVGELYDTVFRGWKGGALIEGGDEEEDEDEDEEDDDDEDESSW